MQDGVSSLQSYSKGLEVIGNNISNVNTTGFKKADAEYGDGFYDTLRCEGTANQVGSGVNVKRVSTDYNTEDASYTGQENNLAINGQGFFRVQSPSDGTVFYTRSGSFTKDTNGYLVTSEGYRLLGTNSLASPYLQVPAQATNPSSGAKEAVSSWSFSSTTGELSLYFADGSSTKAGQVQLSNFTNPQGLASQGGNLYKESATTGTRTDFSPANDAYATVKSQYLEKSNVDLTQELSSMIVTQRAFQAGSRVITTSDQLMQEAIKLKS
jgi:flagellar hook protein FlgE